MSAGWKTFDIQTNTLIIDLLEEKDTDDH